MREISITISNLTVGEINLLLFLCDIFGDNEVDDGSGNLSFLMDNVLDYFNGRNPLELALYGLEPLEDFREAIDKMRKFIETFDEAIKIQPEQIISERKKRRTESQNVNQPTR